MITKDTKINKNLNKPMLFMNMLAYPENVSLIIAFQTTYTLVIQSLHYCSG